MDERLTKVYGLQEVNAEESNTRWFPAEPYSFAMLESVQRTLSSRMASMNDALTHIQIEAAAKDTSILELKDLGLYKYKIISPIQCILSRDNEDGEYFLESIDFDLYGSGESVSDAIQDLKDSIITLYESVMSKSMDELSDYMKIKYELLSSTIKIRENQ